MALPECLLQGGEGWAEEGQAEEGRMSKHHKVSGGGTTKGGIGMDGGGGLSHVQFPKFCCWCALTL